MGLFEDIQKKSEEYIQIVFAIECLALRERSLYKAVMVLLHFKVDEVMPCFKRDRFLNFIDIDNDEPSVYSTYGILMDILEEVESNGGILYKKLTISEKLESKIAEYYWDKDLFFSLEPIKQIFQNDCSNLKDTSVTKVENPVKTQFKDFTNSLELIHHIATKQNKKISEIINLFSFHDVHNLPLYRKRDDWKIVKVEGEKNQLFELLKMYVEIDYVDQEQCPITYEQNSERNLKIISDAGKFYWKIEDVLNLIFLQPFKIKKYIEWEVFYASGEWLDLRTLEEIEEDRYEAELLEFENNLKCKSKNESPELSSLQQENEKLKNELRTITEERLNSSNSNNDHSSFGLPGIKNASPEHYQKQRDELLIEVEKLRTENSELKKKNEELLVVDDEVDPLTGIKKRNQLAKDRQGMARVIASYLWQQDEHKNKLPKDIAKLVQKEMKNYCNDDEIPETVEAMKKIIALVVPENVRNLVGRPPNKSKS